MINPKDRQTDITLLVPVLQPKVYQVILFLKSNNIPMILFETLRTAERQNILYNQTPRATNCDGINKLSRHQSGKAVDFVLDIPNVDPWNYTKKYLKIWFTYGGIVQQLGLRWGGNSIKIGDAWDYPHAELKI